MNKKFEVILAFGEYRVGQIIEPVGLWRGDLLARGYIRPVEVASPEKIDPEPKVRRKKNVKDVIAEQL